jgi:polyhydroxyalkanoate synthesis regulator phasin
LGAAVCMAGWSPSAEAQTASPLIEALVKKGVLTESEGSEIKKEINDDWITQGGGQTRCRQPR